MVNSTFLYASVWNVPSLIIPRYVNNIILFKNHLYIIIVDPNNRIREEFNEPFNNYNDIEDIIDNIFKFIKPSRMY